MKLLRHILMLLALLATPAAATVNDVTPNVTVAANGATTQFNFPFVGQAPFRIQVLLTDSSGNQTQLVQGNSNTQFQVTLNPPVQGSIWGLGGVVTYAPGGVPVPIGSTLTITRVLPLNQPYSLQNQSSFGQYAKSAESMGDNIDMQVQQLGYDFSRAILANPANSAPPNVLPPAAQAAGMGLCFDGSGNNVIACSLAPAGVISSAMAPVVSAATLAAGRAAFGLAALATEGIGAGLQDDGFGSARVNAAFVSDATNTTVTAAFHMTKRVASGPFTYTLPRANTLWNGFGFWVFPTVTGNLVLQPDPNDTFPNQASGTSLLVHPGQNFYLSTDAATSGTWHASFDPPDPSGMALNVVAYGADPTGQFDSSSAFAAWWTACMAPTTGSYGGFGGHDCYIPVGNYLVNANLTWDFVNNLAGGCFVHGAGQNASMINFTTGHYLFLTDSAESGFFYGTFQNFGITATNATAGDKVAFQIGRNDYLDAPNGFAFRDIYVKNLVNAAVGTAAVEINEAATNTFSNVTFNDGCTDPFGNCSAGGDAFRSRQSSMMTVSGSFSGATNGIAFRDGFNFGNVFLNPDLEVDYNDLSINSASTSNNKIIGGQWGWCTTPNGGDCTGAGGVAINVTANAHNNVVDTPNFSFSTAVLGFAADSNTTAITLQNSNLGVITPSIGSSGATYLNNTGFRLAVTAYGSTVSSICTGVGAATCINAPSTVFANPGDTIALSYSGGLPGWVWFNAN